MPILFSNMPKKTLTKSHVLRNRKFIYLIFMKCNNFDKYFFSICSLSSMLPYHFGQQSFTNLQSHMTFSCYRLIIWKMTLHFFHKYLININNDDCCDLNHGKIISPRIFKCKTKAMPKSECIIFKKNAFFSSPGFFSFLFLHQQQTSHIPTYHILHSCEKNPT